MKYHLTTLILFFTLLMGLNAQSEENDENESKKEGPIIELITSGIYAYSLEEAIGSIILGEVDYLSLLSLKKTKHFMTLLFLEVGFQ